MQGAANIGSSSIAHLDTTSTVSFVLKTSGRVRSCLRALQNQVRFEDETPDGVSKEPASLGGNLGQDLVMGGAAMQISSGVQREVLDQTTDADVIVIDVGTGHSRHCR